MSERNVTHCIHLGDIIHAECLARSHSPDNVFSGRFPPCSPFTALSLLDTLFGSEPAYQMSPRNAYFSQYSLATFDTKSTNNDVCVNHKHNVFAEQKNV